ncbi:TraI domain-containing protein [Undibacterium arcticum]
MQLFARKNYGKLTVGNHLEPYLLDAMRQLYRTGFWKINETKSRLWYSPEGLFLIWKKRGQGNSEKSQARQVSLACHRISRLLLRFCAMARSLKGMAYRATG